MTPYILLAVTVLLIAYDVWAYRNRDKVQTISWWIISTSRTHKAGLLIPFALGVLVGHFFWGQ